MTVLRLPALDFSKRFCFNLTKKELIKMLDKKTSIKNRKQTFREIGQQIYELRRQHRMSLDVLSHKVNVPPIIIERWGIGN